MAFSYKNLLVGVFPGAGDGACQGCSYCSGTLVCGLDTGPCTGHTFCFHGTNDAQALGDVLRGAGKGELQALHDMLAAMQAQVEPLLQAANAKDPAPDAPSEK